MIVAVKRVIISALVLLLATQTATKAMAADDPFAADPFADDPFAEEVQTEPSIHQSRIELKSFYQSNNLREDHPFNPGLNLFDDDYRFVGFDAGLQSHWSDQWQTRARVYSRYLAGSSDTNNGPSDKNNDSSRFDTYLLEGLVQWQSLDQRLVVEAGRSKPQWSNGYSYDIANMLQPQRSLPYIDQDNPLQSQGWDMLNAQYFNDSWSFSGYLVKSDSPYLDDADSEAVLRLGYQKDHAFSFLLHKIDGGKLAYGATYSGLLNDSMTVRAEWTLHPYRLSTLLDNTVGSIANTTTSTASTTASSGKQKSHYQRFVIGSVYTALSGWSLTGEYFYNQHGASKQEWGDITNNAAIAADRLRRQQFDNASNDFASATQGLDFMAQGWTREQYASLMFMSAESEELWQWRLSSQLSLDDHSQLHRVEVLKSFGDHLSARLQYQHFNGCDLCEYGLTPSENELRVVLGWLF